MKKSSSLWLWGTHACLAALENPNRKCLRLLMTEITHKGLSSSSLFSKAQILDNASLARLLPTGAVHQGIAMEVLPLPEPDLKELADISQGVIVVLDHVTDPHNVGAILRTAKALGAIGIMMTEHHAPPLSGVLAKAASGALELLPIWHVTNLSRSLEELKKVGFWTVGLDEQGPTYLSKALLPEKIALVMGAEGEGLRRLTQEKCDFLMKLPTAPDFSTLNVSVATGVALYALGTRD
jgi:23S rRNA (guanosine2251-2'-O)-methyltransferase